MPVTNRLRLAIAAVALVPSLASASEFDVKAGVVRFTDGALKTYGFESAGEVAAANASLVRVNNSTGAVTLTKIADGSTIQANLTDAADAVEGAHAFRIGATAGTGLAIMDEAFFSTLVGSRVEVSMWARADGATPAVSVQYGKTDWLLDGGFDFASVTSMRTGRETSDGWVEYTTGPIDGSVWGVPIRAIVWSAPSGRGGASTSGVSYVIDAVEIKKVPGSLTAATACTQDDVETTCGASGDCMYGHCVPSTITWGALPTPEHRAEYAARWSHLASRLIGDRASSEFGRVTFTPAARDLARYALSSRQFFGGINRLVNGLRDNHTSFGSPPAGYNMFNPMIHYGWSGALHACFGVVEKDLLGGGLGFGVFHAGDKPITGVVLKPGDVLTKIDGKDPKAWADAVIPGVARTSPNDAKSDWANYAEQLSVAISVRAKEITITRCASSTACTGDDKKELVIPVAEKIFARVAEKGGWGSDIEYFGCSPRFRNSVADFDEPSTSGYEDLVTPRTVDGIVNVQFDGFSGQDGWKGKFTTVFDAKPAMVLMDTRQGNGGTGDNVEHLLSLMRGVDERIGFITVVNGSYDDPSPATLFSTYKDCVGGGSSGFSCFGAWGFFSELEAPSGSKSKIAWLNTLDVSANDYMPRLLKGRTALKIFGPHPTAGAFGAVTSFSSFMPGFSGGSIQYQDSRFAAKYDDFAAARWESGHGVEPDIVATQKVSDALAGKDTMLETARAWLKASE
jgi:hypothetical protein